MPGSTLTPRALTWSTSTSIHGQAQTSTAETNAQDCWTPWMAYWQAFLTGMWSSLPVTSIAVCLGHRTVLGFMTFKADEGVFLAPNTRIHISWLTFYPGGGSWPSTPGTPRLVPPIGAAWGIYLGLTMSWSDTKLVTPSRRNLSTWNTSQASLVT